MSYNQTVKLKDGTSVVVRPWTLEEVGAHTADFLELLHIHSASLAPTALGEMEPEAAPRTLERLIRRSLLHPEDIERICTPDLAVIQEAIWDVNGLGDFLKGSLALRLKAREAQLAALNQVGYQTS